MSEVTYTGSYWDNDGKYQKMYNAAWKQLVPAQGECDNDTAECLRAISRIGYDYYNNGFCNLWQRWDDDDDYVQMSSYYESLLDHLRWNVERKLFSRLESWLHTQKHKCTWGKNGDHIIDEIIDHVLLQLHAEGQIEMA